MRLPEVFRLSLTFLSREKIRSLFCTFSLGVSVFFCLVFFGVGSAANTLFFTPLFTEQNHKELLVVKPQSSSLNFFLGKEKLTEKDVEIFKNTEGVRSIGRQLLLGFPNSLRINLFGFVFETDSPIFGVDPLLAGIPAEEFHQSDRGIPAVISPQLLFLYNSTLADSSLGISSFTEEEILGKSFSLLFGSSSFLGISLTEGKTKEEKGYIAALSSYVPAIGVALPLEVAQQINEEIGNIPPEKSVYSQIFLEADSARSAANIEQELSEKGYFIRNAETMRSEMRNVLFSFLAVLIVTGSIIFLLSLLLLSSFLSALITRHQYDIGLLLVLGMRRIPVFLVFAFQALFLVGTGTLLGIFSAFFMFSRLFKIGENLFSGNTLLFAKLVFPQQELVQFSLLLFIITIILVLLPVGFFFRKEPLEILKH